jgi:hypothetical protein
MSGLDLAVDGEAAAGRRAEPDIVIAFAVADELAAGLPEKTFHLRRIAAR